MRDTSLRSGYRGSAPPEYGYDNEIAKLTQGTALPSASERERTGLSKVIDKKKGKQKKKPSGLLSFVSSWVQTKP